MIHDWPLLRKNIRQRRTTTTEMTTEMKTETTTTMSLLDQDPMVQSLIQSQHLGITEDNQEKATTALRPWRTIYLPF